jgi:hypothetical protein
MDPTPLPPDLMRDLEAKSRERVAEHERRARDVELRARLLADDDRPRKPGIVERLHRFLRR